MQLYNDDCLKTLKTIKDNSIDLFVTDCPYHIIGGGCSNGAYGNPSGILNKDIKRLDSKGNKYYSDTKHVSLCGILNDYDQLTYTREGKLFKHNDIEFKEWLPDVYRVLKEGTHAYIMINARNLKELQQEAENVGFEYQQILIWDKGNATPNKYYLNAYEMILMLRKGSAKNINDMGCTNILRTPNIIGNKLHPTEKPVSLMEVLVSNSSNKGELVMDCFMGCGSTGIACKKLDRDFIGIEIDEKYFNIAKERINGTYCENKEQITMF